MKYNILIEKSALKALENIPNPFQRRIIDSIKDLENNHRPISSKKLSGRKAWRIRIGNYRVIYEINDDELIIFIIALGHRKDIYR